MRKDLFNQALEKIPMVVAQMANWNTGKEYWQQKVVHYNKWGTNSVWSVDAMDRGEVISMLRRAENRGFEVVVADDGLSANVRRNLPDDEYIIATYTPLVLQDGSRVEVA